MVISVLIAALVVVSLPYWFPSVVVRLRMKIFTRINGQDALQMPNEVLGAAAFRQIYEHPGARGRSRGAKLSDLFWYWLSPGPELHQEHLEDGPRYDKLADLTRQVLALPRGKVEALIDKCMAETAELDPPARWRLTRLRDMVMPLWARFFYELVFQEHCTDAVARIIRGHANDVVTALKCCSLRHMDRRERLTALLMAKLEAGAFPRAFPLALSTREQACFLQGVFFTTGVVQMSDATAHLLMVFAQHPDVQERLAERTDDQRFFNHVISETLRLFPLFGIAHRITTQEIEAGGTRVEPGSVVCFNYPEYHKLGFSQPDTFLPSRWERRSTKKSNYIPFGITANRACPAQGIALISMRHLALSLVRRYRFSTSAGHARSLPNRGPCLLVTRGSQGLTPALERALLWLLKVRDRWEDTYRSIAQLIFGTIMVMDARRLRLCENYFKNIPDDRGGRECPEGSLSCKRRNC